MRASLPSLLLKQRAVRATPFCSDSDPAARQMPAATMLEDAANPTGQASTTAQLSAEDAERLRLKLALLLLGASTFSIVTLAGALIGLRRPPQPIEEGAVSSAGENPPR